MTDTAALPLLEADLFGDEAISDPYPNYRRMRDLGSVVLLAPPTSALKAGRPVRMVEADTGPARRAVGTELSKALADHYRSAGVDLFLDRRTLRIERTGAGMAVILDDGTSLPAADVVVGIGATPNVEWLPGSHGNGIRCTTTGRALNLPGRTYALGDVAARPDPWGEHRRIEHWTSAIDQSRVVAAALAGTAIPPLPPPYFWSDQFDAKLQLTGWPANHRSVAGFTDQAGRLTAIYLDDQARSIAALTANAPATLARCRPLIARHATLDDLVDKVRLAPLPEIALPPQLHSPGWAAEATAAPHTAR